ncbi:arylesterase [Yoonia sp. 208BN28-4]|uniref:arylesterase n=1 Tax=Yoonia sp. 208BN28-4 TaxID=3126505 RepID=UPI00309E1706
MRYTFREQVAFGYGAMRALRNLGAALLIGTGAAQADTVVIAALGDSLTAGYGLPTADGFVPQLQDWLDAQGIDAEVRNAGVSGDTTAGGLSRTDWTLTPEVDAMIVALGGNDYLRGLDPAVSRANLRGILEKAQAAEVDVLLVGLVVGGNYGLDYKQDFEGMYADLSDEFDTSLFPSFFAGLQAAAGMQEGVAEFMQADGIHPNAEGVAVIVDAIGPAVETLAEAAD